MDLFSELSGVDAASDLVLSLSAASTTLAERVVAATVLGLALAEADADVALELDGVAVGELECVKNGRQVSPLAVVLPLLQIWTTNLKNP